MYQQITEYFPTSIPSISTKDEAYYELYIRHCNPCESDRSVKNLKHDLNGDAMDLDSVQKKTVSTVSRKLYLFYLSSVPDFQDWRMTSVMFGEIPFCLYFFLTHGKL